MNRSMGWRILCRGVAVALICSAPAVRAGDQELLDKIKQLEARGLVRIERGKIVVLDKTGLEKLV